MKLKKSKKLLELQKHDTTLEVNLNAIVHNINIHKSLLKPETKVCAMVKAFPMDWAATKLLNIYNITILIIWELPMQMREWIYGKTA